MRDGSRTGGWELQQQGVAAGPTAVRGGHQPSRGRDPGARAPSTCKGQTRQPVVQLRVVQHQTISGLVIVQAGNCPLPAWGGNHSGQILPPCVPCLPEICCPPESSPPLVLLGPWLSWPPQGLFPSLRKLCLHGPSWGTQVWESGTSLPSEASPISDGVRPVGPRVRHQVCTPLHALPRPPSSGLLWVPGLRDGMVLPAGPCLGYVLCLPTPESLHTFVFLFAASGPAGWSPPLMLQWVF